MTLLVTAVLAQWLSPPLRDTADPLRWPLGRHELSMQVVADADQTSRVSWDGLRLVVLAPRVGGLAPRAQLTGLPRLVPLLRIVVLRVSVLDVDRRSEVSYERPGLPPVAALLSQALRLPWPLVSADRVGPDVHVTFLLLVATSRVLDPPSLPACHRLPEVELVPV